MALPDLRNFDLRGKRVLLRVDYDVPLAPKKGNGWRVDDDSRIVESFPTVNYLFSQQAKVILLSHLGRPEGKVVSEYSLEPVANLLTSLLHRTLEVEPGGWRFEEDLYLLENLRFNPGEETNDPVFAKRLASWGDFYINDAFAVCHRKHASIVNLPNLLPHAAGFDLLEEEETLAKLLEEPKRPVVVVLGGTKKDKLESLPGLVKWADRVLIGGKLPEYLDRDGVRDKAIVANLDESGLDITRESAKKFVEEIGLAGTIVWAGPMGKFEEEGKEMGTMTLAKAVSDSPAHTVIGGGETEEFLTKFGLLYGVQYISSGGGAMLEFLANGDLPGLEALRSEVQV